MQDYQVLLEKLNMHRIPEHIAIIMDGNGRWAKARHLPRGAGHKAGVEALRRATELCREIGVKVLTVYAFSTENWQRPKTEVGVLMDLLVEYLVSELELLNRENVRLNMLGDMRALPERIQTLFCDTMQKTANNQHMTLNLAINYGGRDELRRAFISLAEEVRSGILEPKDITTALIAENLDTAGFPDPDLVIRSSGEIRLSNFLIFQSAYSELFFTPKLWPDFEKSDLLTAILDYQGRSRRFGKSDSNLEYK